MYINWNTSIIVELGVSFKDTSNATIKLVFQFAGCITAGTTKRGDKLLSLLTIFGRPLMGCLYSLQDGP